MKDSQMSLLVTVSGKVFMDKNVLTKTKRGMFIVRAKYEAAVDAVLQSCIGLHIPRTRNTMHGFWHKAAD